MTTYYITLPITGVLRVVVEAASEDEAFDKALDGDARLEVDRAARLAGVELVSWEAHRTVFTGNVFHGELSEARIDLVEDLEDS